MLLQVVNIAMGVTATLPGLRQKGVLKNMEQVERAIAPWRSHLGLAGLLLGMIGVLIRIGLFPFYWYQLGASYPQALSALVLGLVLAAPYVVSIAPLKRLSEKLEPQATSFGFLGIAVGLGSLLFGCILPVVCHVPF